MLVAVAIFALASALAYGGLDALMRARGQLDATQVDRRIHSRWPEERDVRGLVPRPVREGYGASRAALQGTREQLELTPRLRQPPGTAARRIERVAWRVLDGSLQRERGPCWTAPGQHAAHRHAGDRVDAIDVRYLDAGGRESRNGHRRKPVGPAPIAV